MKNYFYFVDDSIWFLRDLAARSKTSLFDYDYLRFYKNMHEKYGLKVQFNCFYETDGFNLSEMPDRFKNEWRENSDWLKLAFHSRAEFPEYPYVNSDYDQVKTDCELVQKEIIRFAGADSLSHYMIAHFNPVSKKGCMALRELGIKMLNVSVGTVQSPEISTNHLSEYHKERLTQNKKSESGCYIGKYYAETSLKSYNHFSEKIAEKYLGKNTFKTDEETGLLFKHYFDIILNCLEPYEITIALNKILDYEFIGLGTHEQYFYKDYFNYEPNYLERMETAVALVTKNGFRSIFLNEIVDQN